MKKNAFILALFLALCASATSARADSIVECSAGLSIASLQQSGGCISGGLFFSNFQYNNDGLQISPGVQVAPANVLIDATSFTVTFSTDYGLGGGFTNCLFGPGCIEEEGTLGYNVAVINDGELIAGLGLFGGDVTGPSGGHVAEIGCLGVGNNADTNVFIAGGFAGYRASAIPSVCPEDPAASILLNGLSSSPGYTPRTALFPPVSSLSLAISLFVEPGRQSNVTPFSDAFLIVPSRVPEPSSLFLVGTGLLALCATSLKKRQSPRH